MNFSAWWSLVESISAADLIYPALFLALAFVGACTALYSVIPLIAEYWKETHVRRVRQKARRLRYESVPPTRR
jgi:hypothetical protein